MVLIIKRGLGDTQSNSDELLMQLYLHLSSSSDQYASSNLLVHQFFFLKREKYPAWAAFYTSIIYTLWTTASVGKY